jgi:hypothetical protein
MVLIIKGAEQTIHAWAGSFKYTSSLVFPEQPRTQDDRSVEPFLLFFGYVLSIFSPPAYESLIPVVWHRYLETLWSQNSEPALACKDT